MQSNHPELMGQNSTHLAISVMMWFEKVRRGSICFNYPELVHKHPAHLLYIVKICRVLSHEFAVVRPYRTFSVYIVTGETRSAGCLCTSSGWFKNIEPYRTFSNDIIREIARCVEFCHMSSGWFYCTKPSLSTSLQRKQGMQGAYALVLGSSSTSNLIESSRTTSLQR